MALAFEGALVPMAIAIGWAVGLPPFRTLVISGSSLGIAVLAALPPLFFLGWLLRTERQALVRLRETADNILGEWIGAAGWPALLLLALLAAVGEEALFRGVLQDGVAGMAGAITGWLAVGALFGLFHFLTPLYALLATGAGLYLGGCYLLTGNLFVPIVIHAVYDAAALAALARRARLPSANGVAPGVEGGEKTDKRMEV